MEIMIDGCADCKYRTLRSSVLKGGATLRTAAFCGHPDIARKQMRIPDDFAFWDGKPGFPDGCPLPKPGEVKG